MIGLGAALEGMVCCLEPERKDARGRGENPSRASSQVGHSEKSPQSRSNIQVPGDVFSHNSVHQILCTNC